MNVFHHGGRMGDLTYALYTVKALGGGDIVMTPFHTPGWSKDMAELMIPFLEYQDYVGSARYHHINEGDLWLWRQSQQRPEIDGATHDLWKAEHDHNPEEFPEWHGEVWPGNCHIAKRYAVHFGVQWDRDASWLSAPSTQVVDITFHCPHRRLVRAPQAWGRILAALSKRYKIAVLGTPAELNEWKTELIGIDVKLVNPGGFLAWADYVNSAKVFVGGASSCNVVAEGLKKTRVVELADGCDDTYPYGATGNMINDMPDVDVRDLIVDLCDNG